MKVAIIGSRSLSIDISKYIPAGTTEIISGGAKGIDALAEKYADENNIPKLIINPEYEKYGKVAPLKRNKTIVENADMVIAIWECVKLRPTDVVSLLLLYKMNIFYDFTQNFRRAICQ